jgi:hypothetical protein
VKKPVEELTKDELRVAVAKYVTKVPAICNAVRGLHPLCEEERKTNWCERKENDLCINRYPDYVGDMNEALKVLESIRKNRDIGLLNFCEYIENCLIDVSLKEVGFCPNVGFLWMWVTPKLICKAALRTVCGDEIELKEIE